MTEAPSRLANCVLMLGSSDVYFSESGPENGYPALLRKSLEGACPEVEWEVEWALLYPTSTMAMRAEALIAQVRPRAVVLLLGANTFTEKKVVYAVRNRVPWLYGAAHRLSLLLKRAGGGRAVGSASARGWAFRAPRAIAAALLGSAPLIPREIAHGATRLTLELLAATPDITVVCRTAGGNYQQPEQATEIRQATENYNAEVVGWCDSLGIPCFDLKAGLRAQGLTVGLTPERLHVDLATRKFGADQAAKALLTALRVRESSGTERRKPGGDAKAG